jgi:hypothetical protein
MRWMNSTTTDCLISIIKYISQSDDIENIKNILQTLYIFIQQDMDVTHGVNNKSKRLKNSNSTCNINTENKNKSLDNVFMNLAYKTGFFTNEISMSEVLHKCNEIWPNNIPVKDTKNKNSKRQHIDIDTNNNNNNTTNTNITMSTTNTNIINIIPMEKIDKKVRALNRVNKEFGRNSSRAFLLDSSKKQKAMNAVNKFIRHINMIENRVFIKKKRKRDALEAVLLFLKRRKKNINKS